MKNKTINLKLLFVLLISVIYTSAFAQVKFSDNYKVLKGHSINVWEVLFNNDGSKLYSCGGNNQVLVFNTSDGSINARIETQENFLHAIALNPDNTLLAYGGYNNDQLIICDADNLTTKFIIEDFSTVNDICFSPNGEIMAVAGLDKSEGANAFISLYNTEDFKKITDAFVQHNDEYPDVIDFSKDGKYLAWGICNLNQGIKLYDIESKEIKIDIKTETDIIAIKFSPDGKHIAGAGYDNMIYIADIETGNIVRKLSGFEKSAVTITYSPDGKTLAAAGFDYSCRFKTWDTETGELIQSVGGKGADVTSLDYHPDGNIIALSNVTYGDLFEAPTVSLFYSEKALSEVEWVKINSNENGLIIEFPEEPEASVKSDKYYKYYDYLLQVPGKSYQVRATEYLYDINDIKRQETIDKKAQQFESSKTNIKNIEYSNKNAPSFEKIGYKGDLRYHQRVIFVDNVMYSIVYIDYEKDVNIEEERFFNSFNVK